MKSLEVTFDSVRSLVKCPSWRTIIIQQKQKAIIIFYKALYHLPGRKYFIPFFVRNLVGSCDRPPEGVGPHTIK